MARFSRTRSFRVICFLVTLSLFVTIQIFASRYHSSVYQLTPFNELQTSYESTIATVTTQENIFLVDFHNCLNLSATTASDAGTTENLNRTSIELSTCLSRLFIGADQRRSSNNNFVTQRTSFTRSKKKSATDRSSLTTAIIADDKSNNTIIGKITASQNKTNSSIPNDLFLLQSWLNRTDVDDDYAKLLNKFNLSQSNTSFNPVYNLNDKYIYLALKHVEQLDRIIALNYSLANNPVDREIDRRRSQGKLTNLKISEFADIARIRYGAQSCDGNYFHGANLSAIVFVITKPDDFRIRSLIRKTWAHRFAKADSDIRLYFAFGLMEIGSNHTKSSYADQYRSGGSTETAAPTLDAELIDAMFREESNRFGDIIQWYFADGYYRLTIKSLAILRWASVYCSRVPAIFKIDADCMLNYDNLLRFSRAVAKNFTNSPYQIYGNLWRRANVIRSAKSKFFTSFRDYPLKTYPDYVGGPWFLAGRALPLLLLRVAVLHAMPALLWEDLYISGIVAQKLIDAQFPLERRYMTGFEYNFDPDKLNYCLYNRSIILTQAINESNLPLIWNRLMHEKKKRSNDARKLSSPTNRWSSIEETEAKQAQNLPSDCILTW